MSAKRVTPMRVFISGPMTGIENENRCAFLAMERMLETIYPDAKILNPARNEGPEWIDYMRQSLPQMATCTHIVNLRGHEDSQGACLELAVARAIKAMELSVEGVESLAFRIGELKLGEIAERIEFSENAETAADGEPHELEGFPDFQPISHSKRGVE